MDAPPVQYVKTSDGYNIAFTDAGEGLPFIFLPAACSHVQLNWNPSHRLAQWLPGLRDRFRLVCYDGRGQGLSDRGVGPRFSMASMAEDLEAVVNRLQLRQFVLMGSHATGHVAVAYAAAHPEKVHSLVLTPTSVSGKHWSVIANVELARQNWEFFLNFFNQNAPTGDLRAENVEIMRKSVDQNDWIEMATVWRDSDVSSILPHVRAPTLILHPRDYLNIPVAQSAQVAGLIPNARLSLIEGISAFGDAASGLKALDDFIAESRRRSEVAAQRQDAVLSDRETEVLRFLASGKSNAQIADELVISLNTVRRHVSNIFDKTGVKNRAQAAVYAKERGIV